MPQNALIAAWADMGTWVEQTLPATAVGSSLANITNQDIGNIGACEAFNTPPLRGQPSDAIWGSTGDAFITISNLSIASLSGTQIEPATEQPDTTFHLPFSFTTLDIAGSYSYTQPCALFSGGHQSQSTNATGDGTISWTINGGSIFYVATFSNALAITGANVIGTPAVTVDPDTGGLPPWIVAIGSIFSSFNEAQAVSAAVGSGLTTASFTKEIVALLNAKLKGDK